MIFVAFVYRWTSRDLKKIITAILKSWMANDIKRLNYVQNYSLKDKKVEKIEEKILLIQTENQEDLVEFLHNNFPQKIEEINLN